MFGKQSVYVLLLVAAIVRLSESDTLVNTQEEDCSNEIQSLKKDLKNTKQALSKLILTLLDSKEDSDNDETGRDGVVRNRRDLTDENEDILSQLPISALLGLRGKDGRDGRDGGNGAPGIAGRDGQNGIPGIPGRDGRDGKGGTPGEQGLPGEKGTDGMPGAPGEKGTPGINGTRGQPGQDGQDGAPGATQRDNIFGSAGSVYTRWGRTSCGSQSTLLYSGFAAGSRYDQTGGGVNYQCMPPTPEYNSYRSGTTYSYLSGAEYQTSSQGVFSSQAHDKNVPCARCYTNTRPAVMMLPAKRNCPVGWNREYEGYLMSGYYSHRHQYTFECVDSNPEYISGSDSDTNGALFYFVKPICSGSATIRHCPPYIGDRQLTCAVCSK